MDHYYSDPNFLSLLIRNTKPRRHMSDAEMEKRERAIPRLFDLVTRQPAQKLIGRTKEKNKIGIMAAAFFV